MHLLGSSKYLFFFEITPPLPKQTHVTVALYKANHKIGDLRNDRKCSVIFVGNKPRMRYALAIITSLSANNLKAISLRARGQAITTALMSLR